ncbi:hypothetical protein L6164_002217 [Bauhinia variegata]|uniref:Uncharacterized protein n=1 Tax=Bauhinia variegata TaxID=167791 RepID=A0ACB9PZM6_BAUVA|nr:hypothetical protein L6164_002217 [Bauhinia variegata]
MIKEWLSKRYEARPNWIRNRIFFTNNLLFIWGLVLSHSIVEYAVVSILMLYLVDVMEQSLLVAAISINLLQCFSGVFLFLIAYIAEAYTDHFNVIVFSTGSYTMGLILLWVTEWSSEEFYMFYVAILLLAIGKSVRGSILQSFLRFQLREWKDAMEIINVAKNEVNDGGRRQREVGPKIWWCSAWIFGQLIALLINGNANWLVTFERSAVVMVGGYFTFYSGFFCYNKEKPTKKSLANILRDFKAAMSNKFLFWVAFFPYSLVWATTYTLFVAQTTHKNTPIGNSSLVQATFLFVLRSMISDMVEFFFWLRRDRRKGIPLVRIGAGMVFAVFSCIAARQVEPHRRISTSSISLPRLAPQYVLLGFMEGFYGGGLDMFFHVRLPKYMKNFARPFSQLVLCIGPFSSIFFLLIINGLFDHDINNFYFGRYFLMLAILCSLMFCLYLACWMCYDNSETCSETEESYAMEAGIETGQGTQVVMHGNQAEKELLPKDMKSTVEFLKDKVDELKERGDE